MIIFKTPKILDSWGPAAAAIVPAAIAAAGTIGGALLNKSSGGISQGDPTTSVLAMREQNQFNSYESQKARWWMENQQANDMALQREFAQHGVGWKVADARRAGISPIAAMGSTTFASPTGKSISGAQSGNYSPPGSTSKGNQGQWLSQLGQDVSSAFRRWQTKEQVTAQIEKDRLEIENKHLQNDYQLMLNTKMNKEINGYRTQVGVPAPSGHSQILEGQGDGVDVIKDQVVRHQAGHKAGVHAMRQYREGQPDDKGRIPLYSAIESEAGDAMDADLPTKARYNARSWTNVAKSWAGWTPKHKPRIKKPGYHLQWSRGYGQWMFVPNSQVRQKRVYDSVRDKGRSKSFKRYKIY